LEVKQPPPLSLSHAHHFPKRFDPNFEVIILFSVVERSGYSIFEDDNRPPPTALRARVVSYAMGAYKF
jgi:hypothetical protein